MNDINQPPVQPGSTQKQSQSVDPAQREALAEAQRKATQPQPENFKDEETSDKVVEIGPDMTDAPIRGIDPEDEQQER